MREYDSCPRLSGVVVMPRLKTDGSLSLQSVTIARYKFLSYKKIFPYIKTNTGFTYMKKNFDDIFSTIEVDPLTGRYHINIPEEIINEFGWYEDFVLKWNIDNGDIIITEEE